MGGEALAHEAERPVGALRLFFVVAVEPRPRQLLAQCAGTGKAGRQLLPGAVFEEDDVRAGDALRAADVHEQAVRLQTLDEGIDFLERQLAVGRAAPRGVPAVYNKIRYLAVVCQQLRDLPEHELALRRGKGAPPDPGRQVEHGEVQACLQTGCAEGPQEFRDDVRPDRGLRDAVVPKFGRPEREALVVLCRQDGKAAACAFGDLRPAIAVRRAGRPVRFGEGITARLPAVFQIEFPVDDVGICMELHGGTVPVDKRAKPEVDEVALKRTEMVHSRARLSNFLWDDYTGKAGVRQASARRCAKRRCRRCMSWK